MTNPPRGLRAQSVRSTLLSAVILLIIPAIAGCGRRPSAWFNEPHYVAPAGEFAPTPVAGYDTNADGRIDYLQMFDDCGRKRYLAFDHDHDGGFDCCVDLDRLQGNAAAGTGGPAGVAGVAGVGGNGKTLLVMLDGISFSLVEQLYAEGRFRLFHPPGRLIGGFPTVTDTIFADFFETPRPFGYEAAYYDYQAGRKQGGTMFYLQGKNDLVWPQRVLFRQSHLNDGFVYVLDGWIAGRELDKSIAAAEKWLDDDRAPSLAAIYIVNTDAIGHGKGHEALKAHLRLIDTAIEKLVFKSSGRLKVVVMADHGLNQADMQRLELDDALEAAGFNITDRIRKENDLFIATFGLVSHVAIYTPKPCEAARAAAALKGVELAIYQANKSTFPVDDNPFSPVFVVDGRGAHAVIERREAADAVTPDGVDAAAGSGGRRPHDGMQYRYRKISGDPLLLLPLVDHMRESGRMDDEGWASARAWLDATWDHRWPDAVPRISHAFEGNVRRPSDVLLSLAPNYYYGQTGFDIFASLRGTHGSLHQDATYSFVLTNFFQPATYQRIYQLRDNLKQRLKVDTLLPPER